jgi:hypothetical protein
MTTGKHLNLFVGSNRPGFEMFPGFAHACHGADAGFELMKFHDLDLMPEAVSAEYYWLFSLKRTLHGMGRLPETITIASDRKFTLNCESGQRFANDAYHRYLSRADIEANALAQMTQPRPGYRWLVGQALFFDNNANTLENYHACHHISDLLRFSADAADMFLTPEAVDAFLHMKFLIPSPAVGSFEVGPFFKMLDLLENIAFRYCQNGWVRRGGYQGRNVSFLLQRLHSFLLTLHLESSGLLYQPLIYGSQTVHSESNVYEAL